jgi:hypothetical protein
VPGAETVIVFYKLAKPRALDGHGVLRPSLPPPLGSVGVSLSMPPTAIRQSLLHGEQGLRVAVGDNDGLTLAEPRALDAQMVCDLSHLALKERPA